MEAGTLRCPSCGAGQSADHIRCEYCECVLQTVACDHCFATMFKGSKYCPHCGQEASKTLSHTTPLGPCPRCRGKLMHTSVGNTDLGTCTDCGGLWMSTAALDKICADREASVVAVSLGALPPSPVPADDAGVRYLKCPECAQIMSRKSYLTGSRVILDLCSSHGVWLDRDELRLIIEFIKAGGVDKARAKEKQWLANERRQLERTRDDIFYDAGSSNRIRTSYPISDLDSPDYVGAAVMAAIAFAVRLFMR